MLNKNKNVLLLLFSLFFVCSIFDAVISTALVVNKHFSQNESDNEITTLNSKEKIALHIVGTAESVHMTNGKSCSYTTLKLQR